MSRNLKSLNSGALQCAQSQFLRNFGNPNDIVDGCNVVFIVPHDMKETIINQFAHDYDVPFEKYEVFPIDDSDYPRYVFYCAVDFSTDESSAIWDNTFNTFGANGLVQIYYVGRNENPYRVVGAASESKPTQIFVMTPFVTTHQFNCFTLNYNPYEEWDEEAFILLASDCTLRQGNISISGKAKLIVNGQLTMAEENTINFSEDTDPDMLVSVYLAPQNDPTKIKAGALVGNIKNLEYHGEWNATTRAWFNGTIYFLNGKPLDPIP